MVFLTTGGNIIPAGVQDAAERDEVFISVITEIELFSKPNLPPEEEKTLRAFLANGIPVVNINDGIKMQTIALRGSTALKLPDSIIVATSIILNATLLTNDIKLIGLNRPGFTARSIY